VGRAIIPPASRVKLETHRAWTGNEKSRSSLHCWAPKPQAIRLVSVPQQDVRDSNGSIYSVKQIPEKFQGKSSSGVIQSPAAVVTYCWVRIYDAAH
jgi:hypothetical protein